MSKELKACAPAHSFCSVPRKLTICPTALDRCFGRAGLHLAGNAVQPFQKQRAQRPSGAIAGQHVQVVDVHVALAMRAADLRRVNVREPIVRHHLAGDIEDQPAQRIALVGVGVHAPVGALQVFVDRGGHIDERALIAAQA